MKVHTEPRPKRNPAYRSDLPRQMKRSLEYRRQHRQSSRLCAASPNPPVSAHSSSSSSTFQPLSQQHTFLHAETRHADAENNDSSSDDANLFELRVAQTRSEVIRQIDSANKVAKYVAESEHPASLAPVQQKMEKVK